MRRPGAHRRPRGSPRLRGRARRRAPRDARQRQRGGRRRRRDHAGVHARDQPADRRAGHRRFRAAPRPRHRHHPRAARRRHHQGPRRPGDDRVRPADRGRRRRLHRRAQGRHQRPGDAPRAHLCPRFRRAPDAARRGADAGRRRGDERGRDGLAARAPRHPAGGRDDPARARHPPRAPDRRALPRRHDLVRRLGRDRAPRQGCRPAGDLRRLGQQPGAERERHRPLPHLLQALAAAPHRGRPAGGGRGPQRGRDRRDRVRSQPAGRRDQAPALRRGRRRGARHRDPARRRPPPRPCRRHRAAAAARRPLGRARRGCSAARPGA